MTVLRFERRAAIIARAFVFLAITVPVLWDRDVFGVLGLGALALIWIAASLASPMTGKVWISLAEAAAVGSICGLVVPAAPAFAAALLVPVFVVGLAHGVRGVLLTVSVQVAVLVVTMLYTSGIPDTGTSITIFTWTMLGLGAGLLASGASSIINDRGDPLDPYRDARELLRELLDLTGQLGSGLDALSIGESMMGQVGDLVPVSAITLHVVRDEELTRLNSALLGADVDDNTLHELDALAAESVDTQVMRISDGRFAFTLRDHNRLIGVVSGQLTPEIDSGRLRPTLSTLPPALLPTAIRLDTALLFARFRDAATTEERRRVARDLHDGVVQDIAYLGYLVDALAGQASTDEQRTALQSLRQRITGVVAELRRSVLTLRNQVGASESLGAALGRLARHLTEVSGIPVQVTLEESTSRLRPEVEAEVVRIGQEAMNNAVKHARASWIDVQCWVDPPSVMLTVTDDGRGLQKGRSDSHGLQIMKERATLIGGELDVTTLPVGGTRVSLSVGR